MPLLANIQVNTRYTRSIHLERDNDGAGQPYVLSGRAIQVLGRVADTLDSDPKPRAFALIGPYGSGKSAFGLFLARLVGGKGETVRHARDKLDQGAPEMAAANP